MIKRGNAREWAWRKQSVVALLIYGDQEAGLITCEKSYADGQETSSLVDDGTSGIYLRRRSGDLCVGVSK